MGLPVSNSTADALALIEARLSGAPELRSRWDAGGRIRNAILAELDLLVTGSVAHTALLLHEA
jgi:hypothetical protein